MEMMKALVIEGVHELIYKDIPVPELQDDEVLVKVRACGICGSDIPRAKDGGVHSYPIVIGHEFSGNIVKIGNQVKNFKEGERVTAAPLIPCHSCENCSKGRPAMCTHYSFIGSRQNGAMAQYVAVPSRNIVQITDKVTYEQAACIEPITVAIHGIERIAHLQSGKTAIVYGCGTIGILTMQCLKAKGIECVYVIDIEDEKLELAKKMGAYKTINSSEIDVPMYFEKHGKVDYVFETAGVNILQSQVLSLVKKTGSVVYIGTAHHDVTIPSKIFELILRGELNVTGSWMSYSAPFPGNEWKAAMEYLQSGKIRVDEMITHKFHLSAGYRAFKAMLDKRQNSLKVMYVMD
ncbi:L-iditol 2-dehydrogenase/galactitol-1-phosphate 5-dehydrogenase [Sporomusaceae bacterium BoRhaA]|uniref:galactitol-1-phosphate 5-dehydrogenase n=1 Tax=Pelorhabdus rhamnosifermentans TaxID=2772457 RepID=UPI001C05F942|nr:galactitol-1-phosphate 5-dehydrogenase [Pelorhabdus rhamnosifermentans]MBU2701379.1 L-iditol 2-dehydrogenase/galactitol-1-phosphate 5-dehydrogenase [Pelorhabdus rhamnosifermentans]